jgi:hypothetical protein
VHEREKLQDAEYFLSQLLDPAQSRGFTPNLRALLTAARCVLVYAHKEVRSSGKSGGQEWYERWLTDPVIKFLHDVRNMDVHERPIGTNQTIHLPSGALMMGSSGQPEHYRPAPTTTHCFRGWTGPENALTLCRTYLDRLAQFIDEGQRGGFLTK